MAHALFGLDLQGVVLVVGVIAVIRGVDRAARRRWQTGSRISETGVGECRNAIQEQAATIRLRPILMTSLAFILGVVPLVVASGAGENGRHSVGTTVFGGMIMSTVLNLFFIPVLYLIIEGWREHRKAPEHR